MTTKQVAEKIAELFNHGLDDSEVYEQAIATNEELIAVIRMLMTDGQ